MTARRGSPLSLLSCSLCTAPSFQLLSSLQTQPDNLAEAAAAGQSGAPSRDPCCHQIPQEAEERLVPFHPFGIKNFRPSPLRSRHSCELGSRPRPQPLLTNAPFCLCLPERSNLKEGFGRDPGVQGPLGPGPACGCHSHVSHLKASRSGTESGLSGFLYI